MTESLSALERELAEHSDVDEAFVRLEEQYWADDDWQSVVDLYREVASKPGSDVDFTNLADKLADYADQQQAGPAQSKIWVAVGDIYAEFLDAGEAAMEAYQTAFDAHPHDTTPLRRARRLYCRRREWEVLAEVYEIEIQAVSSDEPRCKLLIELAQVQADELGNYQAAIKTLERVVDLGGDDPFVDQLLGLYMEETTVEEGVREALSRAENALNDELDEAAASAFIEAAQLEYDRFRGQVDEALRLATRALEADPEDADAQLVVEELTKEVEADTDSPRKTVNGRQGTALPADGEAAGDESGDHRAAPQDIDHDQGPSDDDGEEDEEPTVEGFYESIDSFDGSVDEARRALEDDPSDEAALKTVRRHLLDEGNAAALAEVLEDSYRYFRKKEGEWPILTELANLYWLELGDDDKAEYFFKRLKLLDPNHEDVFKFYEAYYEAQGNWRKLFTLLNDRLDHIDDREEYRLVAEQRAEIAEFELQSSQKAIEVWKGFLNEYPGDEDARRTLRQLYEDNEKWNALVDLLKEQNRRLAKGGEDVVQERIGLLEEIAHIYRAHLNLDTMVMKIMAQILELDPTHPTAFGELRDLYESKRRFNDLADLLSEAADRAADRGDVGAAVSYLLEVAEIWEKRLNNQTQAIPYLERIVEIAPEEIGVRDRLREIYEKRRDFGSLFDLRLQEANLLEEAARRDELCELLELARGRLDDPRRQERVLSQLADVDDGDVELLQELIEVRRQLQDWNGVVEALERQAEWVDSSQQVKLLGAAADHCHEKLDDEEEAERLWKAQRAVEPDHGEAFQKLASLYERRGDAESLQELHVDAGRVDELFERLAVMADDAPGDAAALHRRRVRIAEERLDDAERVVEALEDLRDVVDDSDAVRRRLVDWYREIGAVDREIQTRQILLDGETDDDVVYEQMLTICELEQSREQTDAALGWALKAVKTSPRRSDALERGDELARQAGMTQMLVRELDSIAEQVDDDDLWESLWARSGRLKWRELGELESAVEHYEALRDHHPEHFEYLEALDELYEAVERPEDRIEVLETQIDRLRNEGADDVDLVDQLAKIADVQRTHLDEADAARETYSRILDLQSDHLGAIRGKKELLRLDEQWMDVVDYLLREISLAAFESPEAQWEAKLELADLYRVQLDDRHEALRHYGEILGENPEHEQALDAVRKLLSDDRLAREAALLLEPIFRDLQQAAPLAEALEARLRVSDDPFEEQEILDELIPLYADELEQIEEAFEYARRQFEIDPERDDIWLRFEQLGAQLDRWELVEEMFTRESPLEGHDSATRYDLLRHLAAIREHRLQMPEEALEAWKELHDFDPFDEPALEALERLHRRLGHSRQLVDVLRSRAELVDVVDDRIELLGEAARILVEKLDDDVEAAEVCRQILGLDPEHDESVSMLRTLLRRQQRWHDLDALLSEQADQTLDPDKRRDYLSRLAVVRFEQLDDPMGAVEILRRLLDDDPGDDEILEFAQQVERSLADDASRRDLHLELARTLEPIFRMRKNYEQLDEMLQIRLEAETGTFEQTEILDELVEIRQKRLSDPEQALEALKEGVVLQPDDEIRRKKMLEIASGLGRLEEALDTLEEAARGADPFVAGDIWRRLGELAERKIGDAGRAIDCYEQARELDESDVELLEKLERLFEETGSSQRLCDNLIEQTRFAEADRRIELLRRAATLQEHVLDLPVDALDSHRQILEMEPDDLKAIEALERLYTQQSEYIDLVELLRRKVELVDDPAEQIEVYSRWAEVAEDQLHDVNQAIDVYRRILEVDPEHRPALRALDRLLEAEMQWPEWTEILRRRLKHPAGLAPDDRLKLQLRLAEVLVDELFEIEEALQLYRDILERDADQSDAVEALESLAGQDSWLEEVADDLISIYRDQQRWDDTVELYQRLHGQAMDPGEQAEYDYQRGRILEDRLDRADDAMKAYARAWRQDIDSDRYRSALIDLGTQHQSWRLLVDLIEEALEAVVEPDMLRELHLMLAGLWEQMLDEPMEAERHLREVLSAEPDHDEAFETLVEILEGERRWHDLVDLVEERHNVVVADYESEGIELLMTAADIQERKLDDGFSAVETLRRVQALDERHMEANEELERLLTEQKRWEDLADLYRQRAEATPLPSERLESELALADLYCGPLERGQRALELYGRALDIDAEHEQAIEALETIFDEMPEHRAEAARYLEPVYRSRNDDESLVKTLQVRAEASDDIEQRDQWLMELLELFETSVDDPYGAWVTAADLFSDDPECDAARDRLWKLTCRADAWQQLAAVYELILEKKFDLDDELRCRLILDVAHLYADHLDEPTRGREMAEKALQLRPDSEEAVDEMERQLECQGAWHDLADFYRDRAQFSADDDQRRHWYEKLAALYEDVLDDVDATVDVYAKLLEIAPGDEEYRTAMERILATVERWYDLADIYRQRIAAAAPDTDVAIRNRLVLAELLQKELDSPDEAVELLRQILEVRPDHSDAVRALEGLRRDLDSRQGNWRSLQRDIIEILLEAYDENRAWRRIDDLLDEQTELVDEPTRQVEVLVEKAQLLLRSTEDTIERIHALTTLARAYCLDPTHDEIEELIEALADDLEAWQRIVPVYLRALGQTDDVDRQGLILAAVAQIYEVHLDDSESAVAAYQQSVEISARSQLALEKLEELYGAMEKWEPLVDILERRVDEIDDPERRHSLRKRVARIYDERLGDAENALRMYREIRRREPEELSHLVVMERLYEAIHDYEALEELLVEKLQFVDAADLRARTFKRLGEIRRDELGDVNAAIGSFHDALDETPDDVEASQALMDLYRSDERWMELLDVLRSRRDEADDTDEVNALDVEMGDVLVDEVGDAEGAFEHYTAVLERDPQNYAARGALFQLLSDDGVRRRAADILVDLHRQDEEWDELEALYLRVVELSDEPEYVADQYLALAEMQEEVLGVGLKAFATLGEAMNQAPEVDALRAELERVAEEHASQQDLIAIYEDALESGVDDPEVRRELHFVVGCTHDDEYENYQAAARHFEAVLDIDEYDPGALSRLHRIYKQRRDWDNLVRILEDKVTVASEQDKLQDQFQLGYLREVVYEEYTRAFELYREVLRKIPDHAESIEGLGRIFELEDDPVLKEDILEFLEPIFRDTEEWSKLVGVFEHKLNSVDDSVRRAELLREMAQIEYGELDRIEEAFEHWSRALALEPRDVEIQSKLEKLATQFSFYEELVDLYEEVAESVADELRSLELAEKGAQWALERLDDRSRAADLYRLVLDVQPEHQEALEILERVAREEGDDESLAAVLAARVQSTTDRDEQVEMYTELATVQLGAQDYEGAIDAYEALQKLEGAELERLETLAQLYETTERWESRVEALEQLVEYRDDSSTKLGLLVEAGEICLDELDDASRARGFFERAQEFGADDSDVLHGLERVYDALGDGELLEATLGRQLDVAAEADDDERIRLRMRRAQLCREQLGDVHGAIEDYECIYDIRPDHRAAVEALDELYRHQKQWDKLIELLTDRVRRASDEHQIVSHLLEMASVAYERLGAADRAVEFAESVLEIDEANVDALDKLEAIHRSRSDWREVVEVIDHRIERAVDDADRIDELLRDRARTLDEDAQALEAAAETYETILERNPEDDAVVTRLEEIYGELDDGDGMYGLLNHRIERADDDERAALYVEMANVAQKYLGDPDRRIAALEEARAIRGDDLDVVEPLLDAYIDAGQVQAAEPLLESVIETLTEARKMKEVVRFHHLRGKLAERQGEPDRAQQAYKEAQRLDATYIPNLLSLAKLQYRIDDFEEAKKTFQVLLLHQMNIDDKSDKIDVYYHLGAVREKLGEKKGARDMYKRALRVDSNHGPSNEAMERLDSN